jgi:hypothetical protein
MQHRGAVRLTICNRYAIVIVIVTATVIVAAGSGNNDSRTVGCRVEQ